MVEVLIIAAVVCVVLYHLVSRAINNAAQSLEKNRRDARSSPHILAAVDAWEHLLQTANGHYVGPQTIAVFRATMLNLLSDLWVLESAKSRTRASLKGIESRPFLSIPYVAIVPAIRLTMQACGQPLRCPAVRMTIARDRVVVDEDGMPATVYWCCVESKFTPPVAASSSKNGAKGQFIDIKV